MSTKASLKLSGFCLFLTFAMFVLSAVLIWCSGQHNLDSTITIEFKAVKVSLTFANYSGSTVTPENCTIVYNDDETQFKIVGPTPIVASSTTSSSTSTIIERNAVAGEIVTGDERVAMTDSTTTPTGKISSLSDLKNSGGAEFYYFCTNSSAVTNTSYGYIDPGTVYWTSTADTTLESWYDVPSKKTNLYSCFMTPNFTGTEVDSNNCYNGTETQIVISNSVENILYMAFYHKTTITNVAIPQSVKNIGYGTNPGSYLYYGAFAGCTGLAKVDLPNSVKTLDNYAFYNCEGLTSVTMPNDVTDIGMFVFYNCSKLTSITIPDSVDNLGTGVFLNCSSLVYNTIDNVDYLGNSTHPYLVAVKGTSTSITSYTLANTTKFIHHSAFKGCSGLTGKIVIPDGVKSIEDHAFDECSGFTGELIIPSSVTELGQAAFCSCSGLTSVTIPNSIKTIDWWTFCLCSGLTSITIPNGVTSIETYAFSSCEGLKSIYIGSGVTSIGNNAFYNCVSIESIEVDGKNAYYYSQNNCLIETSTKELNRGCKNSTIPSGVKRIGDQAFLGCHGLSSVTLPSSVTSIGYASFSSCSELTKINIPSQVTSIEQYAFYKCTGLTSITIPSSVKSIGSGAFSGCTGLTSVTFANTSKTWKIANSSTVKVSAYSPTNASTNVTYLTSSYVKYTWTRNS